ncbi:multidrug effflux MFS transporter [Parenemella sanctibonifatiensis]|uniref:Bcr/CflA family drug resistance efflux transporter n=1 Tax=Parenemella sanctibonifatiensis TaxID=2016505 RepID=A0A255EI22_9ACTN|nr:multidrug effflux MFS transporter [Parenemella sanctibonifatiensis]OYN89092.1 Bcr/CflA family drug resistance efflux transporter [Parenemella sanctibonifatiensis]
MGRERTVALTLVLALLAMIGPFTIDTVFPAFTRIGLQFGADEVALQQITSIYLVSFAVMSLLHGPLSDAVGRKPVMIIGMVLYAGASIGCALAPSLTWLLVFRSCQGLAAGAGQIVSRAVIRNVFDGSAAQRLMAQVMMIFSVAPALAPIVGGWLLGLGSWQVIFWCLAGYGLALAAIVMFGMGESHPVQARTPLRLGSLLRNTWTVGRTPSFLLLAGVSSSGFAGQFLYIASAPIFVVSLLGKGENDFWIFFVPMIGGMLGGALLNSRLAGRLSETRQASIGYGIALGAGLVNVAVSLLPGAPILPWAVLAPAVLAFGNALAFPILQIALLDQFPRQRGTASSVASFITLMLNAALAGVVAPIATTTVATLAITSIGFVAVACLLWWWHLRLSGRAARP